MFLVAAVEVCCGDAVRVLLGGESRVARRWSRCIRCQPRPPGRRRPRRHPVVWFRTTSAMTLTPAALHCLNHALRIPLRCRVWSQACSSPAGSSSTIGCLGWIPAAAILRRSPRLRDHMCSVHSLAIVFHVCWNAMTCTSFLATDLRVGLRLGHDRRRDQRGARHGCGDAHCHHTA